MTGEPLRFAGAAVFELAVVDPVVVICRLDVVAPELLFNAPGWQFAPVGRPVQETVIEEFEKLLKVNVVEPEPPGAEIVTVVGAAEMAGVPVVAVTVNVVGAEFNGV